MNTPDPLNDPRFQEVLAKLRALPAPEPSADFTARTLERLKPTKIRPSFSPVLWRAAAALAILCSAGLWFVRPSAPVAKAPSPIDILMAAQRPDGGWSTDAQHSRPRYDTGVTALALLALLQDASSPPRGAEAAAIRAGIQNLLRQQNAEGRFGAEFSGADFTHYLATMALSAALRMADADPTWSVAAARAQVHLPPAVQMAKLNQHLAAPDAFPARWADAGGPVTHAALQMLKR
jgi:hypothetical protein